MKKVLCLILALSLVVFASAAAFADGLMSFDLEIVNDQPTTQKDKPTPEPTATPAPTPAPTTPASSGNGGNSMIDVPLIVEQPSGSGSNNGSNPSGTASPSVDADNGSNANVPSIDADISTPSVVQDSGPLTIGEQLLQNAENAANAAVNGTNTIADNQVPLGAGTSTTIGENIPQIIAGPEVDLGNLVTPLDGGIAEHDISDFEINGDAMHSLRIRASVLPGSVVNIGDRVELTAIPMGFMGVNFKIQWQMAEVDSDGNMGEFHNIPGAFGLKYMIVFTNKNINNHWRAAITIVE